MITVTVIIIINDWIFLFLNNWIHEEISEIFFNNNWFKEEIYLKILEINWIKCLSLNYHRERITSA